MVSFNKGGTILINWVCPHFILLIIKCSICNFISFRWSNELFWGLRWWSNGLIVLCYIVSLFISLFISLSIKNYFIILSFSLKTITPTHAHVYKASIKKYKIYFFHSTVAVTSVVIAMMTFLTHFVLNHISPVYAQSIPATPAKIKKSLLLIPPGTKTRLLSLTLNLSWTAFCNSLCFSGVSLACLTVLYQSAILLFEINTQTIILILYCIDHKSNNHFTE